MLVHFEGPRTQWLSPFNVLMGTARKGSALGQGGDDLERKSARFLLARKYQAAGCKRVQVVPYFPATAMRFRRRLHNETIVNLWIWAFIRDGYFF